MAISKSAKATNPLLIKREVGRAPQTVYNLPGPDHVYGVLVERNPNDSAAVVLKMSTPNKAANHKELPPLDYITMNRNTAKKGLTAPKEINEYRKKNLIRLKPASEATRTIEEKRAAHLPSDKNPGHVYGLAIRPSTPVARLMTDQYQKEWLEKQERKKTEETKAIKAKEDRKNDKAAQATLTFKNRKKADAPAAHELFKMKKFSHATTKLDTGRKVASPPKVAAVA